MAAAEKKAGGPKLYGEEKSKGEIVQELFGNKKYPYGKATKKNPRGKRDQAELDRAQAYIKKNPNFGKDVKEEMVDEGLGSDLAKPLIRAGIKVGGKTGGKVVKTVIKKGGEELKNQAVKVGGELATDAAKKIGQKVKEKGKKVIGPVKEEIIPEAKVDAGKSPETKEKDRNVRKFGVSHNVSGHGKLRRSLHKMNRGDKKIKGDKSAWTEMESVQYEGVGDAVKAGVKRHKDAVEKKKVKDRKAVPYAALAAEHQPEGEMVEELSRRSKPSAKAKMAKLDAILKRREDKKVSEKEALKTEGLLTKKRPEKKAEKAMDAGARAKRKLQRREYAAKVSGSEDNVPDDIREGVRQAAGNALGYAARVGAGIVGAGVQALSQKETIPKVSGAKKGGSSTSSNQGGMSAAQSQAEKAKKARVDARKKAIKKIKDDRRDRATNIMTAEKAAKKVKKEGEDKKFQADSGKPIVAEFVDHLWEASKKCSKCGKVYKGKSCSCCA